MTPREQVRFESAQNGLASIAVGVAYREPLGRGTEQEGVSAARYFYGRLCGEGIDCAPWGLQFCGDCLLVFLSFPSGSLNAALAEVLLSFSEFEIESTARLGVLQPSGAWEEFFPAKGAAFEFPAEVELRPAREFAIEDELGQICARNDALAAAWRMGTVSESEAEVQIAVGRERAEAIISELASHKVKNS